MGNEDRAADREAYAHAVATGGPFALQRRGEPLRLAGRSAIRHFSAKRRYSPSADFA
jgi:hypothetical protein